MEKQIQDTLKQETNEDDEQCLRHLLFKVSRTKGALQQDHGKSVYVVRKDLDMTDAKVWEQIAMWHDEELASHLKEIGDLGTPKLTDEEQSALAGLLEDREDSSVCTTLCEDVSIALRQADSLLLWPCTLLSDSLVRNTSLRAFGETLPSEKHKALAAVWKQVCTRETELVVHAARAHSSVLKHSKSSGTAATTNSLLALLSLAVRYGDVHEAVLTDLLGSVPSELWHPFVSQLVTRLRDAPPSIVRIIRPVMEEIIGARPEATMLTLLAESTSGAQQGTLGDIYRQAKERHSEVGEQLERFQQGLVRIATLWEDEAATVLQRAAALLSSEQEDRDERAVALLEQLHHTVTSQQQHQQYQQQQRADFAAVLGEVLGRVKQTGGSVQEAVVRLEQCLGGVTKSRHSLRELDPELARLAVRVALPGVPRGAGRVRLDDTVYSISTKARPKRIALVTATGQRVSYLLKGRDDLRVDRVAMELVAAANAALRPRTAAAEGLALRTYGVVPLAPRCGLVEWVDGALPLYTLYERYNNAATSSTGTATSSTATTTETPAECFRRECERAGARLPRQAARHAAFVAMRERGDATFVRRVLGVAARDACAWQRATRCYARSLAAGAVVGHALGLGDRHLGNVLLDAAAGRVVHVDCTVCFGRARLLRVPETVPFRLTDCLVRALGVAGVAGAFRAACCRVLARVRSSVASLQALAEALVFASPAGAASAQARTAAACALHAATAPAADLPGLVQRAVAAVYAFVRHAAALSAAQHQRRVCEIRCGAPLSASPLPLPDSAALQAQCAQHSATHTREQAALLRPTPTVRVSASAAPGPASGASGSAAAAVAAELGAAEQRLRVALGQLAAAWRRCRPRTLCAFWAETLAACPAATTSAAQARAVLARWDAFCAAQAAVPRVSDAAALAETVHALRECLHEVQGQQQQGQGQQQQEEEEVEAVDAAAEPLLERAAAALRLHACTQPHGCTPLHSVCTPFLERVAATAAAASASGDDDGDEDSEEADRARAEAETHERECRETLGACDAELGAALGHVRAAVRAHSDHAEHLLLAVDHAAAGSALCAALRVCVAEGRAVARTLADTLARPARGPDACAALVDLAVRCSELAVRHAVVAAEARAGAGAAPAGARLATHFEESPVAACAAVRGVRARVEGGGADVAAHVDALVAEARDPVLLSAMFEGWMAWI